MSEFTLEEMKRLRELLDEEIKKEEQIETLKDLPPFQIPLPFPYTPHIPPYQITSPTPTHPYNQQEGWCAIREYFKAHPNETSVMMVCFCRLCSVRCQEWHTTNGSSTITTITISGTSQSTSLDLSGPPINWINQY